MRFWLRSRPLCRVALLLSTLLLLACATPPDSLPRDGLADATVLVIRHAEKPAEGRDLSHQGRKRAQAYAHYFRPFVLGDERLTPSALFAARSSLHSRRPVETLEPLAHALGLKIDQGYSNHHDARLVRKLHRRSHGPVVLIAWHHGRIADLIDALGGNAATLLPGGTWPDAVYDWVVVLRYDAAGRVRSVQLVQEPAGLVGPKR